MGSQPILRFGQCGIYNPYYPTILIPSVIFSFTKVSRRDTVRKKPKWSSKDHLFRVPSSILGCVIPLQPGWFILINTYYSDVMDYDHPHYVGVQVLTPYMSLRPYHHQPQHEQNANAANAGAALVQSSLTRRWKSFKAMADTLPAARSSGTRISKHARSFFYIHKYTHKHADTHAHIYLYTSMYRTRRYRKFQR